MKSIIESRNLLEKNGNIKICWSESAYTHGDIYLQVTKKDIMIQKVIKHNPNGIHKESLYNINIRYIYKDNGEITDQNLLLSEKDLSKLFEILNKHGDLTSLLPNEKFCTNKFDKLREAISKLTFNIKASFEEYENDIKILSELKDYSENDFKSILHEICVKKFVIPDIYSTLDLMETYHNYYYNMWNKLIKGES